MITPGQAHDVTAFPALMQEIDCDPEQMLGDKGYDSEAVRNDIEERGGEAAIPSTATRKIQHAVDKALYALRNRIERFFNRAKNSRRVATRYDKLIESFAAFVLLACIQIWIKFVHTAYQSADAQRQAFTRALKAALAEGMVKQDSWDGADWLWREDE